MQMIRIATFPVVAFLSIAGPVVASPVVTKCGALVSSTAMTEIAFFSSPSEVPVVITGTTTSVNVPPGESRCIRVRFSAIANCPNACFLRASENDIELNPAWVVNPLRFSQDSTNGGTAHSFEWVGRAGAGKHTIRIRMQTGNTIANADIGPWTMTVDVMQ